MLSNKVKTILKALQGHLNFRIGCFLIHFGGLLSERNEEITHYYIYRPLKLYYSSPNKIEQVTCVMCGTIGMVVY